MMNCNNKSKYKIGNSDFQEGRELQIFSLKPLLLTPTSNLTFQS